METETLTVHSDALQRQQEWIADRNTLIHDAQAITVVDSVSDLEKSGAMQTSLGKLGRTLDKERRRVTEPLDRMKKHIMQQEKDMRAPLEEERVRLKKLNDDWATRMAAKAAEEARKIQEENERRRLEAAENEAATREMFGDEVEIATEPVEEVKPAPEPQKIKTTSNRIVPRWSFTIIDPHSVPREFLSVDEKKIRSYIAYQISVEQDPVVPGVQFEKRMSVESR